jgi:hypothetical protein
MGGRGETVLYKRLSTSQHQREAIKADIIRTIDAAVTNITVIALVETRVGPNTDSGGQGRRIYATNPQQRADLKAEITRIIDAAATDFTVISLVEGGQGSGSGGQGTGSG